ncbi:hypothetical protein HF1_01610 [Mycoplasma haemofelis str. Langford 1]|uniref:Uncharacterized protein n=2 Tax=Mycoplasma haemofelis TaxID=29501 RepID=F6FG15_MYCHI|nr:hypothetical protein [Mycoplasma haemofelis]AEG72481.1 hypothetical protein MHF_0182 [Mycoplasma haemofelis Ohio2]CBY92169.1 hypothetical protein HF1_01610 [Mycoplasma haemofelis str. Langford 1]
MPSPANLAGLGAVGALSAAGGMGALYFGTKETIYDYVHHRVLGDSDEFDDSWQQKFGAMKNKTGEFEHIKNKEDLRGWCRRSYLRTYRSLLQPSNDSFLAKVEENCIQPLAEKIGESLSKEDADHKTNYKKLKDYSGELPRALKKIKESLKDEPQDNDLKDFKAWCNSTSKKPYKGKDDSTFQLMETFCKK